MNYNFGEGHKQQNLRLNQLISTFFVLLLPPVRPCVPVLTPVSGIVLIMQSTPGVKTGLDVL